MNTSICRGIVLRVAEQGESDKRVTLYSPDLGRITGIAKGAKKSKRRFVNKLEEFSWLQFSYRPSRLSSGLFFMSTAELLEAHISLRTDFRKYIAATYICELIVRFTCDHDPDPQLYAILHWALTNIHQKNMPLALVPLAHLRLLDAAGYRPALSQCSVCAKKIGSTRTYVFLPGKGTILCSACFPQYNPSFQTLSVQTLRLLIDAQNFSLDRLPRLHFSQQALLEAATILYRFTLHLVQQDLHAWRILQPLLVHPKLQSSHLV